MNVSQRIIRSNDTSIFDFFAAKTRSLIGILHWGLFLHWWKLFLIKRTHPSTRKKHRSCRWNDLSQLLLIEEQPRKDVLPYHRSASQKNISLRQNIGFTHGWNVEIDYQCDGQSFGWWHFFAWLIEKCFRFKRNDPHYLRLLSTIPPVRLYATPIKLSIEIINQISICSWSNINDESRRKRERSDQKMGEDRP